MHILNPFKNLFLQWRDYGGGMGPGMMGWGYMGWLWTIITIVFWVAVIIGIIFLIRWLAASTKQRGDGKSGDSALEILKKRYARGEINKEEYEERRRDMER